MELVVLVWHSVPIVAGVVRSVATVFAVGVGSTVVVVAIGSSTAGMAWTVGMAGCCICVGDGLGGRAVCLTCICPCLCLWGSSHSLASW